LSYNNFIIYRVGLFLVFIFISVNWWRLFFYVMYALGKRQWNKISVHFLMRSFCKYIKEKLKFRTFWYYNIQRALDKWNLRLVKYFLSEIFSQLPYSRKHFYIENIFFKWKTYFVPFHLNLHNKWNKNTYTTEIL
jgi:hypothetical protein